MTYQSVKINCPCGGKFDISNESRHKNTIKHYNYMVKINPDFKQYGRKLCQCGGKFTQSARFHHYKSKKHIDFLKLHEVDTDDEQIYNEKLYNEKI